LRFLIDTQRGSTRKEVDKEGEGTPATTATELLVTNGEKLQTLPWIYEGEEID
jgi:hypothetical protein